ncbi:EamA-like transporter family protein [compost metagenome]
MKAHSSILKGSLFIILAACCYGMLGTFVKLAYRDGYGTDEVTISQFSLGFIALLIFNLARRRKEKTKSAINGRGIKSYAKVIIAGTSLGLTSIFYYLSIKYLSVGIGIVLLVQATWMSLVVEMIQNRRRPEFSKVFSVVIILFGTIMATNVLHQDSHVNWKGIVFGILAAISYTTTMYSSNNIGLGFSAITRSFLMISGGFAVVLLAFFSSLGHGFSFGIFVSWGLPIALFGTILPPILFAKGMPLTGVGLGAIFTSLEIPVSIIFANALLDEQVAIIQWMGIFFILTAVVLKNVKLNL